MINYVELIRNHTSTLHMVCFPTSHSQIESRSWDTRISSCKGFPVSVDTDVLISNKGPEYVVLLFIMSFDGVPLFQQSPANIEWEHKVNMKPCQSSLRMPYIWPHMHTNTHIPPFEIGTASVLECCRKSLEVCVCGCGILHHSSRRKASSSLKDEGGWNLLCTLGSRITHNASVMFRWWLRKQRETFELQSIWLTTMRTCNHQT